MPKNHLRNLLFVLVVLFAVMFGGIREPAPEKTEAVTFSEPVEQNTNLTASVEAVVTPAPEEIEEETIAATPEGGEPRPEDGREVPEIQETTFMLPVAAPGISAASALVKELFRDEPIFDLHPNKEWPTASLAKLMTAVVALDKIPSDSKITVSQEAVATEGVAGYLVIGDSYDRDHLLQALLVYSSNDAAAALAEYYNKSLDADPTNEIQTPFIVEMNRKAASLGMYNTQYFDPHGLSPDNQSTVNDLEKLVHHIFNLRPEIFGWTRIQDGNTHPFVEWENFIGGKTGFLDEANGNLITLFNDRGRLLIILVLGSEDRASDTEVLYNTYSQ